MTKPTAWMPFYVGDYLRDTSHLTMGQHGAYLLLIMHYWSTGKALPDDARALAKIVGAQGVVWERLKPTLAAFFKVENGHWYHERIERELIAAHDRKDAAVRRGKASAAVRWGGKPSINQAIVKHSNHSKSMNLESENLTDAARDPAQPGGSGPRAHRTETSKERLARLAAETRAKLLKGP